MLDFFVLFVGGLDFKVNEIGITSTVISAISFPFNLFLYPLVCCVCTCVCMCVCMCVCTVCMCVWNSVKVVCVEASIARLLGVRVM